MEAPQGDMPQVQGYNNQMMFSAQPQVIQRPKKQKYRDPYREYM